MLINTIICFQKWDLFSICQGWHGTNLSLAKGVWWTSCFLANIFCHSVAVVSDSRGPEQRGKTDKGERKNTWLTVVPVSWLLALRASPTFFQDHQLAWPLGQCQRTIHLTFGLLLWSPLRLCLTVYMDVLSADLCPLAEVLFGTSLGTCI